MTIYSKNNLPPGYYVYAYFRKKVLTIKDDPRIQLYATPRSSEFKKQRSEQKKEWHKNNHEYLTCEHCGKINKKLNHNKWHGAKCKFAPH